MGKEMFCTEEFISNYRELKCHQLGGDCHGAVAVFYVFKQEKNTRFAW